MRIYFFSPVHTMQLMYNTQCIMQKFHGVYVRDTCFMRFLEFHETVSLNRTLLCFLKLVLYASRQLANHSSAFPEGQSTCNSCLQIHSKKVFQTLSVLISKLLCQSMVSTICISSLNPPPCPANSYYSRPI